MILPPQSSVPRSSCSNPLAYPLAYPASFTRRDPPASILYASILMPPSSCLHPHASILMPRFSCLPSCLPSCLDPHAAILMQQSSCLSSCPSSLLDPHALRSLPLPIGSFIFYLNLGTLGSLLRHDSSRCDSLPMIQKPQSSRLGPPAAILLPIFLPIQPL
jgi:hypothetical protein